MSINRVTISGNLTRDPEVRSTASGMQIMSFGMAVNDRRRNNQTGEWEESANFVDCVLFGNRADWLSRELRKGKKAYVEGKLRYSSWEKDGQKRSKLEVVVDDIDFERPPRQQAPQGYAQPAPQYPQQGYQQPAPQSYPQQYPPQGYAQPASAPQAPQPAAYPQQQQYAPQPAPQQVSAAPQQAPAPQQQQMAMPQQQPAPAPDVYDEDIPF